MDMRFLADAASRRRYCVYAHMLEGDPTLSADGRLSVSPFAEMCACNIHACQGITIFRKWKAFELL